jgi:hypothetical protein
VPLHRVVDVDRNLKSVHFRTVSQAREILREPNTFETYQKRMQSQGQFSPPRLSSQNSPAPNMRFYPAAEEEADLRREKLSVLQSASQITNQSAQKPLYEHTNAHIK